MEERQLNEKESLELIARMIQNTQRKMEKGNGMPFLVWGYTTIVVSLLIWYFFINNRGLPDTLFVVSDPGDSRSYDVRSYQEI
jgi:hypothetical protein